MVSIEELRRSFSRLLFISHIIIFYCELLWQPKLKVGAILLDIRKIGSAMLSILWFLDSRRGTKTKK